MRNKIRRHKTARKNLVIKWFLYSCIVIITFIYLTLPIGKVKPLILIPIALCIAMYESVTVSCGVGILCGMLLDVACGKVLGFNALLMLVFCMFTSLAFMYLFRVNIVNLWIMAIVSILLHSVIDLFFFYIIWSIHNISAVFLDFFLPQILLNIIISPLIYLLFKTIYKRFGPITDRYIEEKNENITRL